MFARSLLRKNNINPQSINDVWNSICILLTHTANLALMLDVSRTQHWLWPEPFRPCLRWNNSTPVPSGTWRRQRYHVGKGVRHRSWYWCEPRRGLSSGTFSEAHVPSSRFLRGISYAPAVTPFTVSVAELFQEATGHSHTHCVRAPAPLFSLRGQVWLPFFSQFSKGFCCLFVF